MQGLAELFQSFGEAKGVRLVGAKVLEFAQEGSVVLLSSSPVDCISMNFICHKELLDTWPIRASSHGWVCMGMERPRMNGASMPLGRQKLQKGAVKVIGDERGDGVLLAIGDNKKVASSSGIPVIMPSGSWKHTGLRTIWGWSGMFLVC